MSRPPVTLAPGCRCFLLGSEFVADPSCAEHGGDGTDVTDEADDGLENGTATCSHCGVVENIDLLDGMDDGTGDFTLLGCVRCAGPDWLPAISLDAHRSVAPGLELGYARHHAEVVMRGIVCW